MTFKVPATYSQIRSHTTEFPKQAEQPPNLTHAGWKTGTNGT